MSRAEEAGDRYWTLIEPVWIPLNDTWSRGVSDFLVASRTVPRSVLNLYAAHWCQSEVNNGGFHQFFYNTTGLLAPEAVEGFSAIGLPEWSALLAEAMGYFPVPYPRERALRLERLPVADGRPRAEWDPFTGLDDRFYESGDAKLLRWELAADEYALAVA
jgi:hypothetical protein